MSKRRLRHGGRRANRGSVLPCVSGVRYLEGDRRIGEGLPYLTHDWFRNGRRLICRHVVAYWTAEDAARELEFRERAKRIAAIESVVERFMSLNDGLLAKLAES